jgi:predicted 3-demethylubiquinone-9 3-methyltransferase (glyoxalase superfamily)
MPKIIPYLWFDKEARQAAELYTSLLPNSRIKSAKVLTDTPSGSVEVLTIELSGQEFGMMSAGPLFKFTPAVSFLVACNTKEEVDSLWNELSKGGSSLVELGTYPFSERYGWLTDRFGLSWQLMFTGARPVSQKITPSLLFAGGQAGHAEDAISLYTSLFPESSVGYVARYGGNEAPEREGTVKHAMFTLSGQQFTAMDSARSHNFTFNEAISLMVLCETQNEIDHYWGKLSADPKSEQCGWLKDRFGVSWQVIPTALSELLGDKDKRKVARVTQAFLQMKKFDIAKLLEAAQQSGESAA